MSERDAQAARYSTSDGSASLSLELAVLLVGFVTLFGSQFAFAEDTKTTQPAANTNPNPKEITLDLGGGIKIVSLLIPNGEFLMGGMGADSGQQSSKPVHKVKISKPFYMGKNLVTVGQFRTFVEATKYITEPEKMGWGWQIKDGKGQGVKGAHWRNAFAKQDDNYPVVLVSWHDAQEFCKWASKTTGRTIRLPTEAEWEYACRAGTTTRFYSGDSKEDLDRISWNKSNSNGTAHPVGEKEPNQFGLYDMEGNVWQWCQDLFSDTYYEQSPAVDPQGPPVGSSEKKPENKHVFRGGSWDHPWDTCGCAHRAKYGFSMVHLGIRVVVECVSPQ